MSLPARPSTAKGLEKFVPEGPPLMITGLTVLGAVGNGMTRVEWGRDGLPETTAGGARFVVPTAALQVGPPATISGLLTVARLPVGHTIVAVGEVEPHFPVPTEALQRMT